MTFNKSSKIASAIVIVGVLIMTGTSLYALNTLKIGSNLYRQIVLGKDMLADILPPPEYIIEPYLEATLALQDPAGVAGHKARLEELRKAYDERHDYWVAEPFDEELRSLITKASHEPALKFWAVLNEDFLPALSRGDIPAAELAYKSLSSSYAAHRAEIDKIVVKANAFVTETEARSRALNFWLMTAVFGLSGLVVLLICASAAGLTYRLVKPLTRLTHSMEELAQGNFDIVLPGLGRKDEIGAIAGAVETFKTASIEKAAGESQFREQENARQAAKRKAELEQLADQFQEAVGKTVEKVSAAATELQTMAGDMTERSEATQDLSTRVAKASEETSSNVQSIAASTSQFSSTVEEISRQVQDSSNLAKSAVDQATVTNTQVSDLSQSAEKIGDVIELINDIASQTNLLALNATIEAARAGEAGRGFAVVAQDVKKLAAQTEKATGDIAEQVTAMQTVTAGAVESIQSITSIVEQLSEYASGIAAAVEQQGATTKEIGRNVSGAAEATSGMAGSISEVQKRASETGEASANVLALCKSVAEDSGLLMDEVTKFVRTVRSA